MSELNIYQRINEVKKEVTYVQKDAKIQGYKAVTHDQVTAVLRGSMVEHGIVTTESFIESTFTPTGDSTKSGAKYFMYTAVFTINFVNIDEPKDLFSVNVESQSLDYGDKAPGKAQSYAMKYALLKTFGLETGENEEGRQEDFKQKRENKQILTKEQSEQLNNLLDETEANRPKFFSYFGVTKTEELSQGQYVQAFNMLKAKK